MAPTLFLFFLVCYAVRIGSGADDSVVTDSPIEGTTFNRSIISRSELSRCRIHRSGIQASRGKGSTIVYSFLRNSSVVDSVLNATYSDPELESKSTAHVFRDIDRYFLNRIFDSQIQNAKIDASPMCHRNGRGYNSSVYLSTIFDSTVRHSEVIRSNLTNHSRSCASVISLSNLHRTHAANSVLRKLNANTCNLFNDLAENILCEGSRMANCKLNDCTVSNSSLANSVVNGGSHVLKSLVDNSVITDSKVIGSEITSSNVSNSKLRNCIIINSDAVGKNWDSMKVVNGVVVRSGIHGKHFPGFVHWG